MGFTVGGGGVPKLRIRVSYDPILIITYLANKSVI